MQKLLLAFFALLFPAVAMASPGAAPMRHDPGLTPAIRSDADPPRQMMVYAGVATTASHGFAWIGMTPRSALGDRPADGPQAVHLVDAGHSAQTAPTIDMLLRADTT